MHFQILWRRHRRAQRPRELNTYPATPTAYYEGQYPGSRAVRANRFEFTTAIQRVELNTYPVTQTGYYSGYYPGSKAVQSYQTSFPVKRQTLPELNRYPITSSAFIEGYYPGSTAVQTNRVSFNATLQTVSTLSRYRTTADVAYTAWITHFERTRPGVKEHYNPLEHNAYPATPASYYEGHYPGSAAPVTHRYRFRFNLQTTPELNSFPGTTISADVVSWQTHFEPTRNYTRRKNQRVELNTYPATPAAFYDGYYPAHVCLRAYRTVYNSVCLHLIGNEFTGIATAELLISHGIQSAMFNNYGQLSAITTTMGKLSIMRSSEGHESEMNDTHGINSEIN